MKVWVATAMHVLESRGESLEDEYYYGVGMTAELARAALLEKLTKEFADYIEDWEGGIEAYIEDGGSGLGVFDPVEVEVKTA